MDDVEWLDGKRDRSSETRVIVTQIGHSRLCFADDPSGLKTGALHKLYCRGQQG